MFARRQFNLAILLVLKGRMDNDVMKNTVTLILFNRLIFNTHSNDFFICMTLVIYNRTSHSCFRAEMSGKEVNLSYEMRLKECGLTTLETRRLRGDQIEVFKILNGYENIDRNIFFSVKEERRTRGHGVTLAKKQCRLDIRKF